MTDAPFDVLVIGAGVAGLAAARHAAEGGLRVACAEQSMFGGLVINVNELDPALSNMSDNGADLASDLMTRAADLGVGILFEAVTGLERDGDLFHAVTVDSRHRTRALILATGARLKRLGIPGEDAFEHRGVSHCADCDGPMFEGQDVVVVGGGDSALQEAQVLARFCRRVHLVHRRGEFSARPAFVEAVRKKANIELHMHCMADEICGDDGGVRSVLVQDLAHGRAEEIACTGFFAYVGLAPNSEFLPPEVRRDGRLLVETDAALHTTWSGVFAAGAVRKGFDGLLTGALAEAKHAAEAVIARSR